MITLELITDPMLVQAGGGIMELFSDKLTEFKDLLKVAGGALALLFIITTAWRAKGALPAILMGAVVAALFIWFLNNTDDTSDLVDREINGSAPLAPSAIHHTSPPINVAP